MEKRRQNRSAIVLPADLAFHGHTVEGLTTRNISLGGVFIEPGDYPLPRMGETVTLTLRQTGAGNKARQFQARVGRVGTDGVALLFQDFDLDDFEYLQELMG